VCGSAARPLGFSSPRAPGRRSRIAPGVFVPTFPVYVVADDPIGRFVEIAVGENLRLLAGTAPTADTREYAERLTKLRLHQPVFRARVLRAYEQVCAICRLRHVDLLDAAHILSNANAVSLSSGAACRCARSTTRRTTGASSAYARTTWSSAS
jgi:hypothetical protein